jgi:hypothetical protein
LEELFFVVEDGKREGGGGGFGGGGHTAFSLLMSAPVSVKGWGALSTQFQTLPEREPDSGLPYCELEVC